MNARFVLLLAMVAAGCAIAVAGLSMVLSGAWHGAIEINERLSEECKRPRAECIGGPPPIPIIVGLAAVIGSMGIIIHLIAWSQSRRQEREP